MASIIILIYLEIFKENVNLIKQKNSELINMIILKISINNHNYQNYNNQKYIYIYIHTHTYSVNIKYSNFIIYVKILMVNQLH